MAVKKRPSVISTKPTVEEFINQGLTVLEVEPVAERNEKPIKLRVESEILAELDGYLKELRPSPSRNHWIVKAIVEKLERDQN